MKESQIEDVLSVLRKRTGVDFSRYRAPTVQRRILNRMLSIRAASLDDYVRRLDASAEEAFELLERISIKVSRFYRNAAVFDALREQVIPALDVPVIRIWSVGCGRGEEAYTLAMLLQEAGREGVVEASDIDPSALAIAESAVYPPESTAELPAALRARHLEPVRSGRRALYRVAQAVRERVRFSRHDATSGAPAPGAGRFHVVCCRNLLIYWEPVVQQAILRRLLGAMAGGGFLCMGEAEWPHASIAARLQPIGSNSRIFRLPAGRREA
jgi:chemotaxis protein methyltransferase CheR